MIFTVLMAMLGASGPTPTGNPGEWITTEDYPASEFMRGKAGISVLTLQIDEEGRVRTCEVAQSSGSDALDATACALLRVRGKFTPAHDDRGKAVPGSYTNRVRWQIPEHPPQPLTTVGYTMVYFVDIDDNGVVEQCAVKDTTRYKYPTGYGPCAAYPVGKKSSILTDSNGKKVKARVTFTTIVDAKAR